MVRVNSPYAWMKEWVIVAYGKRRVHLRPRNPHWCHRERRYSRHEFDRLIKTRYFVHYDAYDRVIAYRKQLYELHKKLIDAAPYHNVDLLKLVNAELDRTPNYS
jgi:hypothetical protein